MATNSIPWQSADPSPAAAAEDQNWYALHTRPRHEKLVVQRLVERGVETFLPIVTEVHRWSDRKKSVQLPMFNCHVFAKFTPIGWAESDLELLVHSLLPQWPDRKNREDIRPRESAAWHALRCH
jgi:hypothetical protein